MDFWMTNNTTTIDDGAVETDRLAKLIRLIFSSDKSGEIIAAVAAAKRVLAVENKDAHWLADKLTAPPPAVVADKHDDRNDRSAAWFAFHRSHRLSPKESAFVANILQYSRPLSDKQKNWLHDIVDRLEAR
jgi:hypothetical protein